MTRIITPDGRAEALGERLRRSAAQAAQRVRALATEGFPGGGAESAGGAPAERAEYLVSTVETAAVGYSRVVGDRLRRVFARAREEMEDVVAEAQSRRSRGAATSETEEDVVTPS